MNEELARVGTFLAELIEWKRSNSLAPGARLPVHKRVMRPIVAASEECFVFGLAKCSAAFKHCTQILRPARGKHILDTSQEVVLGYEVLWNSAAPDRGSIVAVMAVDQFDRSILRYARRFLVLSNPGASNSPAAIRYCKAAAKAGKLAFCFNHHCARNMQVYGPPKFLQSLYSSLPKRKRLN